MSTNQEYWDACLIRTWRAHGTVQGALDMYQSITGVDARDSGIKRVPVSKRTYGPIREFVAQRLEKISAWLFKCGPEHDKDLLRKLSGSSFDVSARCMNYDYDRKDAIKESIQLGKVIDFTAHQIHVSRENSAKLSSLAGKPKSLRKAAGGLRSEKKD